MSGGVMRVKIPYYVVDRWGNGYWMPKPHMREKGFQHVPCGKDGPKAWAIAKQWNDRWLEVKAGKVDAVEVWPSGSLGDALQRFKRTSEWTRKEPRTREDWERGWKHIKDVFGDRDPKSLTLEDLSLWYSGAPDDPDVKGILHELGIREAHRAVKIWRALWQVAAALKYCDKDKDPSAGIRRVTPRGRTERWSEGEVVRLVKRAWRDGFRDLACIIAIIWDTQFQPGDVRVLAARHRRFQDDGRLVFDCLEEGRQKTEKPVVGTLCRRTERLLKAHLANKFGDAKVLPDTLLFRTREGSPYSKDLVSKDFRKIRAAVFGSDEQRQLLDFRRSGALEALAGKVDPAALSNKMGNTIEDNKALQDTYLPAKVEVVRLADAARVEGRRRMRKGG
jgi:hypothetical protein